MGQDLILEFTVEMFTMKQFEQVSPSADVCPAFSLCASLTLSLPPTPFLPQLFLPSLLRFTTGLFSRGDLLSRNYGLNTLVSLILAKAPPPTDGSMAFETYPLLFTGLATG